VNVSLSCRLLHHHHMTHSFMLIVF
jgi:hypothetical protein